MRCRDIVRFMEEYAPNWLAEDWDNIGLVIGSLDQEIGKIMVCLDVTNDVADEAISSGADMIISHHPVIFKGLKNITDKDPRGRVLMKLIRNDISVFCAHTNLDVATGGVNDILAQKLGLINTGSLKRYKIDKAYKLVVYVPQDSIDKVRDSICRAGAGWIGNYSDCTFMVAGTGTFRPLEGTNPYIGTKGNLEKVSEYRLESIVPRDRLRKVIKAMLEAHPYEEVAYDLFSLENAGKEYGIGVVGQVPETVSMKEFINLVKEKLSVKTLRFVGNADRQVKKAAVFCGSFDGDLSGIIEKGIDVIVTGDIKYHTAAEMVEMGISAIDAGHFNTERIIVNHMAEVLSGKFPEVQVSTSTTEKDPFNYY